MNKDVRYVRMQGRDDVGTVISTSIEMGNIGSVRVRQILIEATGEVCVYALDSLTPCDESGNPIRPA